MLLGLELALTSLRSYSLPPPPFLLYPLFPTSVFERRGHSLISKLTCFHDGGVNGMLGGFHPPENMPGGCRAFTQDRVT